MLKIKLIFVFLLVVQFKDMDQQSEHVTARAANPRMVISKPVAVMPFETYS